MILHHSPLPIVVLGPEFTLDPRSNVLHVHCGAAVHRVVVCYALRLGRHNKQSPMRIVGVDWNENMFHFQEVFATDLCSLRPALDAVSTLVSQVVVEKTVECV